MAEEYADYASGPSSFGKRGALITPSATDLEPIPKAVVCLSAGNVTIVPAGNANATELTFTGVPAGYVIPYRVRRVTAATATVATVQG